MKKQLKKRIGRPRICEDGEMSVRLDTTVRLPKDLYKYAKDKGDVARFVRELIAQEFKKEARRS